MIFANVRTQFGHVITQSPFAKGENYNHMLIAVAHDPKPTQLLDVFVCQNK